MRKKLNILASVVIVILILSVKTSFSQPPPPGGGLPPCWPPPCIPIDGGVSILLAAGALYGGKKIYNSIKQ